MRSWFGTKESSWNDVWCEDSTVVNRACCCSDGVSRRWTQLCFSISLMRRSWSWQTLLEDSTRCVVSQRRRYFIALSFHVGERGEWPHGWAVCRCESWAKLFVVNHRLPELLLLWNPTEQWLSLSSACSRRSDDQLKLFLKCDPREHANQSPRRIDVPSSKVHKRCLLLLLLAICLVSKREEGWWLPIVCGCLLGFNQSSPRVMMAQA